MAGKVTLAEVKAGIADLCDLQKINSLLDMEAAAHHAAAERAKRRQ